jgi:hypothetical protein
MSHPIEFQIDDIIAKCDGDLRSAIKILLVVNEQLEADLRELSQPERATRRRDGDAAIHLT